MCTVPVGPADYDASLMYVTLLATTNSMTTAELRITIQDEDILERDEDFDIMLDTTETRVNIANSTSVVIVNDDGELILRNPHQLLHYSGLDRMITNINHQPVPVIARSHFTLRQSLTYDMCLNVLVIFPKCCYTEVLAHQIKTSSG